MSYVAKSFTCMHACVCVCVCVCACVCRVCVCCVSDCVSEQMTKPAYPGLIDGYGLLTWLNTDMTKPYADGTKPSHCCGPRWNVRGEQSCATAPSGVKKCGACCKPVGSYNGTQAPCLPGLPVIPEFNGGSRAPNIGDPCEVVHKSIVGDSFPDADWHQAPADLGFVRLTSTCSLATQSLIQI